MTAAVVTRDEQAVRSGYARAVRSEWIKATSLRSTWILIGFALAAAIGLPALLSRTSTGVVFASSLETARALFTALDFVLILVAVLGALLTTAEFTTGMARNTFVATPSRGAVLAAKTTVAAALALAVGVIGFAGAWAASAGALADLGGHLDLGDADTLRLVLVNQLSIVVFAVLAVALGFLLRSSVGTIFTVVALQLILPGILLFMITNTVVNWIGAVLPGMAATQAASDGGQVADGVGMSPGVALVVLVAWAVVPYLVARLSLKARDI